MYARLYWLLLFPFFLWSCGPKEGTWEEDGVTYSTEVQTRKSGLKYIHHKKHKGVSPAIQDYILMNYVVLNKEGDTTINTFRYERPIAQQLLEPPYPGAIEEGLALLKAQDSMTIFANSDNVFPDKKPRGVEANEEVRYVIKVYDIFTPKAYEAYMKEEMQAQFRKDLQKIQDTARNSGANLIKHKSGLLYTVSATAPGQEIGEGEPFQPGDSIVFDYTSTFLGGFVFDTTVDQQDMSTSHPVGVTIGSKKYLSLMHGWKVMLGDILREGMQARAYIASPLAFGPQGKGAIPPNAVIVTLFRVREVHRGKNQQIKEVYELAKKTGGTVQAF